MISVISIWMSDEVIQMHETLLSGVWTLASGQTPPRAPARVRANLRGAAHACECYILITLIITNITIIQLKKLNPHTQSHH